MSEWGIEQPSTFGRLGGCLVEAFACVGGITAVALAVLYLARTEHTTIDAPSPKIESVVKQDTISRDTIMFTLAKKQRN